MARVCFSKSLAAEEEFIVVCDCVAKEGLLEKRGSTCYGWREEKTHIRVLRVVSSHMVAISLNVGKNSVRFPLPPHYGEPPYIPWLPLPLFTNV
jgi:hypothetical protein